MALNLSRYLAPYGFLWRFPIADRPDFGPEQTLRYAELLFELRDDGSDAEQRAQLLRERALIEELAGRIAAAHRSLAEAIDLAAASAPALGPELRYQLAKLRFRTSDFAGAQADLEALVGSPDVPAALRVRALLILGRVSLDQGRFGRAVDTLTEGLAGTCSPRNRFSGHLDLVYAHVHTSDHNKAESVLDDAARLAEPNNQLDQAALAYYRAWLAYRRGQQDGARSLLGLASEKLHAQPSTDPLVCCELMLGLMAFRNGFSAECLAQCDRALALLGPQSRPDLGLSVHVLRGWGLTLQGRYAAAIEQFRRAREQAALRRRPVFECRAYEGVAAVHTLAGETQPAREALELSLRSRRQAGDPLGECIALTERALAEQLAGALDRSRTTLEEAEALALSLGNVIEQGRVASGFAELEIKAGRFAESAAAAAEAASLFATVDNRKRQGIALSLQAQALSFQDLPEAALAKLDEAAALAAGGSGTLYQAEILIVRADVLTDAGRADGAQQVLAQARELAELCGAEALLERLRRYSEELKERESARRLLERYLDRRIVARVLARPERRVADSIAQTAAILFSDVRGYTALSERLTPHEVVTLLNEHFEAMAQEIDRFEGVIDKFIGDAIMVVFGDPGHPRPDDAARAVKAAVAMVERRRRMNAERRQAGLQPVEIGVGVHVGEVVMGHIGSKHRISYTVIGDAVNVAARLESATKEHRRAVLVSEEVARSPEQDLPVEFVGELALKGRAAPVRAFTVSAGEPRLNSPLYSGERGRG